MLHYVASHATIVAIINIEGREMKDLEYLARNVHEWPSEPIVDVSIGWAYSSSRNKRPPDYIRYQKGGGVSIYRAQWQAERDRLGLDATTDKCDDTENSEDKKMETTKPFTLAEQMYIQQSGRAERKVTLKPGDYCDVRDTTPEQRKAIADAFVRAGCKPSPASLNLWCMKNNPFMVWDVDDGDICGYSSNSIGLYGSNRLLTIDQVLNATNAACTDVDPVVSANVKAFNEATREHWRLIRNGLILICH